MIPDDVRVQTPCSTCAALWTTSIEYDFQRDGFAVRLHHQDHGATLMLTRRALASTDGTVLEVGIHQLTSQIGKAVQCLEWACPEPLSASWTAPPWASSHTHASLTRTSPA